MAQGTGRHHCRISWRFSARSLYTSLFHMWLRTCSLRIPLEYHVLAVSCAGSDNDGSARQAYDGLRRLTSQPSSSRLKTPERCRYRTAGASIIGRMSRRDSEGRYHAHLFLASPCRVHHRKLVKFRPAQTTTAGRSNSEYPINSRAYRELKPQGSVRFGNCTVLVARPSSTK